MIDEACEIRRAVSADIEYVVALERKMDTVPHWAVAIYLGSLAPTEQEARDLSTRRCLFVASRREEVLGFAVVRVTALEAEVLAELESVGVADSARRKGVGRRLCDAAIRWARVQGAGEIELEVRSRSDGAIALYRGLGFSTVGVRSAYYRSPEDDAVLMRLMLAGQWAPNADADYRRE